MSPNQLLIRYLIVYALVQIFLSVGLHFGLRYTSIEDQGFVHVTYIVFMIIVLINMMGRISKIAGLDVNFVHSIARGIATVVPAPLISGVVIDFIFSAFESYKVLTMETFKPIAINAVAAIIVAMFYTKPSKKTKEPSKQSNDETIDSIFD